MDVAGVRGRISSTLDANADVRQQAEHDLKYAEEQQGFIDALVDILDAEQEAPIRLSTAVYLKNRVTRGWSPSGANINGQRNSPISPEEKARFRSRLLPLLAGSLAQIRQQLIPILQKILDYDYPHDWPDYVAITLQLLNTNDPRSVFAGLQCILALCRAYRFKIDNREEFNKTVAASFPRLLTIGNGLLSDPSDEACEMLRVVMKAFKQATYSDLPPHLRGQDIIVGWCTLFLNIVSKEAPPSGLSEDIDERELSHWWKAKKWAYYNLNRLFVRYGNPSTLQKDSDSSYTQFSESFINDFAPEILKTYLRQIEKWVGKTAWISKPCLSFTLAYLDECVKPKAMWTHLKPHMENLISHVLFPILCQSDEDIELFESDPPEYLHRKLTFYEEVSAPDVAATTFLTTLAKSRRKQTFTILQFVNDIVERYEAASANEKNPREKEGALRMIGTLASVILAKKSPIAPQVESFFVQHVFPEFRSPHGYLRARACETLEKFEQLNFHDENNLIIIYQNILESMADPELPVRVEAALALQPLIRHDIIRTAMQQNIPQIMQQLLKLANEVDVDALANVMEDFVEVFATELTPFAVALTEQLRDTYLRIVREILERNTQKDADDTYGDLLDDKSITALGVLQTVGTLILTLESTPDVLLHLETILMPVISITLENSLFDLYNEVFEIIDSCTFSAKTITPTMWQAFELMHKTFKSGAELYLEDMLPALDNFVTYGSHVLIQNPQYLDALVDMVFDIFREERTGGVDRICGCKLAESLMLNLPGQIDQHIPKFVELAMNVLVVREPPVKSYRVHLMEMVVNALYYNSLLTLHTLESKGWTNRFFSLWFSNIDNLTRVHDKKLSIAAIVSLLSLRGNQVPVSVQQGWPRLLTGIARLFQTLPAALKNREEATTEDFSTEQGVDEADNESDAWGDETEWQADNDEPEGDVKDESSAYIDFLHSEAQKFGGDVDDDDEELEEESLLETPLDKVEPYSMFRNALLRLQQEAPQLYQNLTNGLNPDERAVVEGAIRQAEVTQMSANGGAQ